MLSFMAFLEQETLDDHSVGAWVKGCELLRLFAEAYSYFKWSDTVGAIHNR